jgi:hypothetical protein
VLANQPARENRSFEPLEVREDGSRH